MKMLTPKEMKTLKVFHLLFVMMWTIGLVAMALLLWRPSVSGLEFLYAQIAALYIDYTLVIPGAILTVVTGIIYGLKTKWGFFKHGWITVKWIIGIAIILIGTFWLHPLALAIIEEASPAACEAVCFPTDYFGAKLSIVNYMALVQSVALIFLVGVSVFKPWSKKKPQK